MRRRLCIPLFVLLLLVLSGCRMDAPPDISSEIPSVIPSERELTDYEQDPGKL